jgi:hypothetical protein
LTYGDCTFLPEDYLMTLHVVLPTGDGKQLAWVTDTSAFFGRGNTSRIRKIEYLEKEKIVCSSWGDFAAADVVDRFTKRCEDGDVELSNPRAVTSCIKEVGEEVLGELPPQERAGRYQAEREQGHGVIVLVLREPMRLYVASIGRNTIAREATGEIIGGDLYNAARIFPQHYFPLSTKTLAEAIRLGVHTVRVAKTVNSQIVGDPVVWIYDGENFRRLESAELEPYIEFSKSIDSMILEKFRT